MRNLNQHIKGKTIRAIDGRHACGIARNEGYSTGSIVFIEFEDGSAIEFSSCIEKKGGQQSRIKAQFLAQDTIEREMERVAAAKPSSRFNSEYLRQRAIEAQEAAQDQ